MKITARSLLRRCIPVAVAGTLIPLMAACTGRGGGYLPPKSPAFNEQASFGFSFSCQDAGGTNPPTGTMKIELDYTEHGTSVVGGPFSVHGTVDQLNATLESAVCIGKNPPITGSLLIFLGRYRPTSTPPPSFPSICGTSTTPVCRFEVQVKDNDGNFSPSKGDTFSIQLSGDTTPCLASTLDAAGPCSTLKAGSVFYTRAGILEGGNITVN